MKTQKTKKKKPYDPQGVRINPELHGLVVKAAALLEANIGECYSEAAVEWLKRKGSTNTVLRAMVDQACSGNAEVAELFGVKPHSIKHA